MRGLCLCLCPCLSYYVGILQQEKPSSVCCARATQARTRERQNWNRSRHPSDLKGPSLAARGHRNLQKNPVLLRAARPAAAQTPQTLPVSRSQWSTRPNPKLPPIPLVGRSSWVVFHLQFCHPKRASSLVPHRPVQFLAKAPRSRKVSLRVARRSEWYSHRGLTELP
ncbi:hypothetical protein EDB87DRAFT_1652774, partial [Lactarius vividus]